MTEGDLAPLGAKRRPAGFRGPCPVGDPQYKVTAFTRKRPAGAQPMVADVLDALCAACGKRPARLEIQSVAETTYRLVTCRCGDAWIWVIGHVEARS
jgi:hypothetical protein